MPQPPDPSSPEYGAQDGEGNLPEDNLENFLWDLFEWEDSRNPSSGEEAMKEQDWRKTYLRVQEQKPQDIWPQESPTPTTPMMTSVAPTEKKENLHGDGVHIHNEQLFYLNTNDGEESWWWRGFMAVLTAAILLQAVSTALEAASGIFVQQQNTVDNTEPTFPFGDETVLSDEEMEEPTWWPVIWELVFHTFSTSTILWQAYPLLMRFFSFRNRDYIVVKSIGIVLRGTVNAGHIQYRPRCKKS